MLNESKISVLILYTVPRTSKDSTFTESESGVLDEVTAVVNSLKILNIPNRVVGIRQLTDLPVVLSGADETVVFNLVEGFWDNAHTFNFVPAVANAFGKACTGNETNAMLLSLDKWQTKVLLQSASLPCPYGIKINPEDKTELEKLNNLPDGTYIIKPVAADASEGVDNINIVSSNDKKTLFDVVCDIHKKMRQSALIEQYIDGRELNISVICENKELKVLPLAEIIFRDYNELMQRIVGYKAKWDKDSFEYNNTIRSIPADIPQNTSDKIKTLSILACHTLSCSDYCRVDFRLDKDLNPYILEVNANPDISPDAGFVAALLASGRDFDLFVKQTIDNAISRYLSSFEPINSHSNKKEIKNLNACAEFKDTNFQIRWCEESNRDDVLMLLSGTGFFRLDEIEIAKEVLDAGIKDGITGHYRSYVIEKLNYNKTSQVVGWICFGPTPCTVGSFDLYWIAVSKQHQGQGVGKLLMNFAECEMKKLGARLSVIETSSREIYNPTRSFYEKLGYTQNACIPDFYDIKDHKVVFTKAFLGDTN